MTKFFARVVLLGAVLSFATAVQAQLIDVTLPGDTITGVDLDDPLGLGTWPAGEAPLNAINNVTQKYLNFGVSVPPGGVDAEQNTGFIVTPSFQNGTGSIVTGIRLFTANDAPERDPASYLLAGATSPTGPWTTISSGPLELPTLRNPGGLASISTAVNSQTVMFANTNSYTSYRLTFPTVRSNTANSMQISDVELLTAVPEPSTFVLAAAGLIGLVVAVRRRRS